MVATFARRAKLYGYAQLPKFELRSATGSLATLRGWGSRGVEGLAAHVLLVVIINCLLAALVLWLTAVLWRWRCELVRLTGWLRSHSAANSVAVKSQQMGLALTLRRSQLIEAKLGLTRLQLMSRQLSQLLRLLSWLIQIGRWRRSRRRS